MTIQTNDEMRAPAQGWSQSHAALAEELREYTAMKYAGDCKCGKCQLVPRALVERIYHTLNSTPARSGQMMGGKCRLSVETQAAGAIIDAMTGGGFDWRSRIDESDFLQSADWLTALEYARAALSSVPSPGENSEERIAQLQYEAGMYQSLYENARAQWQPIETAPKDGSIVFIAGQSSNGTWFAADAKWDGGHWCLFHPDRDEHDEPSFGPIALWMPIPAFPSQNAPSQEAQS